MTPFSILPRNLLFSFDNGISSDENVAISVTRLRLVLHLLWTRFTKFLQISNTCQEALLIKSSATDLKCFWPFNSEKLPSVKPKLKSAIGVD